LSGRARFEFVDAVRRAPTAAVEEFFDALADLDDSSHMAPEFTFDDAPALWRRILRRNDVSLALVARAGLYFWETSEPREAPATGLAAYAMTFEADPSRVGAFLRLQRRSGPVWRTSLFMQTITARWESTIAARSSIRGIKLCESCLESLTTGAHTRRV
jgi:hypothetical protein